MTDWDKPSVYVPFFRRFTDERARELKETWSLHAALSARYSERGNLVADARSRVLPFLERVSGPPRTAMLEAMDALIAGEPYLEDEPQPDIGRLSLQEFTEYRNRLRFREYFFANEEAMLEQLHSFLVRTFCAIADWLPASEAPSPFTIPLIYTVPEPKKFLTQLLVTIAEPQYMNRGLFLETTTQLNGNICDASGVLPGKEAKKPYVYPIDSDLPLDELVDQFFAGTPFQALFKIPVPLKLTHEDRFSHMHIVGGTGAGKTTLLENLIAHDFNAPDCPSLIIVDSQGDLINKLSHLARFNPDHGAFRDRFVLITPKDIQRPPALNIFDVNRSRLSGYDDLTKEQVTAGVIQTFDYLFSGLLGADLTAKQGVFFKFVARLMLALPETMGRNATILDMMALMEDATPYKAAIASLPPIQRNFFERDFGGKTFVQTKEQIRYRLQAIIENPAIARLFTSPETRIDLFAEMNKGSIILVDTAKDFLKGASSHFGRIFISLVLQAVLERAAIPEDERRPTFLIVDEAASYFDSNIDDLLTEARKYKVGCVFAHQFLDQCTSSLRASLAANTSIKMVSGVSMQDARALAPDMRTTPDFILSQPRLHFAAHFRNSTPQAVSIPARLGALKQESELSRDAYERLRELNRDRVSLPLKPAREASSTEENDIAHSDMERKEVGDPTAPSSEW